MAVLLPDHCTHCLTVDTLEAGIDGGTDLLGHRLEQRESLLECLLVVLGCWEGCWDEGTVGGAI